MCDSASYTPLMLCVVCADFIIDNHATAEQLAKILKNCNLWKPLNLPLRLKSKGFLEILYSSSNNKIELITLKLRFFKCCFGVIF